MQLINSLFIIIFFSISTDHSMNLESVAEVTQNNHTIIIRYHDKQEEQFDIKNLFGDFVETSDQLNNLATKLAQVLSKKNEWGHSYLNVTLDLVKFSSFQRFYLEFDKNFIKFGIRCMNIIYFDIFPKEFHNKYEKEMATVFPYLTHFDTVQNRNGMFEHIKRANNKDDLRSHFWYLFFLPFHIRIIEDEKSHNKAPVIADIYDIFGKFVNPPFLLDISKHGFRNDGCIFYPFNNKYMKKQEDKICFDHSIYLFKKAYKDLWFVYKQYSGRDFEKIIIDVTELENSIDEKNDQENKKNNGYTVVDKIILKKCRDALNRSGVPALNQFRIDAEGNMVSELVKTLCTKILDGTGYSYKFINIGNVVTPEKNFRNDQSDAVKIKNKENFSVTPIIFFKKYQIQAMIGVVLFVVIFFYYFSDKETFLKQIFLRIR